MKLRNRKYYRSYYTLNEEQKQYLAARDYLDVILGSAGLVLLSPVLLGIMVAIKVEEGPRAKVFFSQKRVGKNRRYFQLYKFRSMREDTPHDQPTHLLEDPDQYITKVGRFLRKTSLDELPQLLNIAKGEVAVIGPRPALWNQDDLIELREKAGVHQLKPGLTGYAQIHGRDELSIEDKANADAYYLRNVGPWMDIRCFFGTFLAVLRSDGVVEGGTGAMK